MRSACKPAFIITILLLAACESKPTDVLEGRVAFTRRNADGVSELWLIDAGGKNERRLFANDDAINANVMLPRWVGPRVEVVAMKNGAWALWSVPPEGGRPMPQPGNVDDRMVSWDSHSPDLEVRQGELFAADGTELFSWNLYDRKLNPGVSEASWSPDRRHAIFQTCTGSSCKIQIARVDGSKSWTLTRGRQPAWGR